MRSVSSLTRLLPVEKQSKNTRCSRRAKPSTVGAKNMASSSGCAITRRALLPAPGRPACSGDLIRSAKSRTRRKPHVRTATATHKSPTTSMPGEWQRACAVRKAGCGLGLLRENRTRCNCVPGLSARWSENGEIRGLSWKLPPTLRRPIFYTATAKSCTRPRVGEGCTELCAVQHLSYRSVCVKGSVSELF